jgi:glycosyltransferase involved in cell wall biosynthesis
VVIRVPTKPVLFGRVVLEAMQAVKPVVATRGGGIPETLTDEVEGFLVPPGTPEILTDRLEELLANPALCERMGIAGRERAEAFSPRTFAAEMERVYASIMVGPGGLS